MERKKVNNEEPSWAMEILQDYKLMHKRDFIIKIILIVLLVCSVTFNIYTLYDTSIVSTVDVQQENDSGDNNYIGNDGDINGKTENKNN